MPYEIEITSPIWNKVVFTKKMDFLFALEKV